MGFQTGVSGSKGVAMSLHASRSTPAKNLHRQPSIWSRRAVLRPHHDGKLRLRRRCQAADLESDFWKGPKPTPETIYRVHLVADERTFWVRAEGLERWQRNHGARK